MIFTSYLFSQITVTKTEGSPVGAKLVYGKLVNDGSTLKREKMVLNDANCPIQLNDVGIETSYSDGSYYFKQNGSFTLKEPITAYELNYMIYDVFGEHIKTLSGTKVIDIERQQELSKTLSWYASGNDVEIYFICVAYVANVRTKNGQLWHYNYTGIKEQLDNLKISFEKDYLPSKDSDKGK